MTDKQKEQARTLFFNGKKTIAQLAYMYRVSSATIVEALRARNEQP